MNMSDVLAEIERRVAEEWRQVHYRESDPCQCEACRRHRTRLGALEELRRELEARQYLKGAA